MHILIHALGLADRVQQGVRGQTIAPLRALAEVTIRARALVGGLVQTCVEIKIYGAFVASFSTPSSDACSMTHWLISTQVQTVVVAGLVLRDPGSLGIVGRDRRVVLLEVLSHTPLPSDAQCSSHRKHSDTGTSQTAQ